MFTKSTKIGTARCDDSGLCDEMTAISRWREASERCVYLGDAWALLVDASPIAVGHCLFSQFEHLPRSTLLGLSLYIQRATEADWVRQRMATPDTDIAMVEHGSSDRAGLGDCVRHSHWHLCPIPRLTRGVQSLMLSLATVLREAKIYSSWPSAYAAASRHDEYVLVAWRDFIVVGVPRPVRQVARVVLAQLCQVSGEVDWALDPWNERFDLTSQTLTRIAWQR